MNIELEIEKIIEEMEQKSCGICNLTKLPCIKLQPECVDCDIAHLHGWFNEPYWKSYDY